MNRSAHSRRRRLSDGAWGCLFAALLYGVLLYLVNVTPGWQALPLVTDAGQGVVPLLNLALVAGMTANIVYMIVDSARARAVGTYVTSLVWLMLTARLLDVFPFAFEGPDPAWASTVRILLVAGFAWALFRGMTSAVRLVRGRSAPRLAANHSWH